MSVWYLGSSAWLKRYFREPGQRRIMRLFEEGEQLASSVLGYIEVTSALARQQTSRRLDEQELAYLRKDLKEDWNDLTGLPLSFEIVDRAIGVAEKYRLRGADAIHLATALVLKDSMAELNDSVVLVASDRELLDAAQKAGLSAMDPMVPT